MYHEIMASTVDKGKEGKMTREVETKKR